MRPDVVLITGASRGIGAATARLAAQRGYAVCVNYRTNRAAADEVVAAIAAEGGRAFAVAADISVESNVVGLFAACDRELGPVTALVNNAGVLEKQARVESMDAARLQRCSRRTSSVRSFARARPCSGWQPIAAARAGRS